MKKVVLNAWADTLVAQNGNRWESRLNFECTSLPDEIITEPVNRIPGNRFVQHIRLKGLSLAMAEDCLLVADGLIRSFTVENADNSQVVNIYVFLDFPTEPGISRSQSMNPCKFSVVYPRDCITRLMTGKYIGIDPGHGGKDSGVKGPVNLREKDVALAMSLELGKLLRLAGSHPIFTRDVDVDMSQQVRLGILMKAGAQMCVKIHTSGSKHPEERIYRILVSSNCPESQSLAASMVESLWERMGIRITSVKESDYYPIPAVQIEPLCLSHYADEANFRAPLFQKRLGQSLFNGILRYLNK